MYMPYGIPVYNKQDYYLLASLPAISFRLFDSFDSKKNEGARLQNVSFARVYTVRVLFFGGLE
jgi:hypothetical protein